VPRFHYSEAIDQLAIGKFISFLNLASPISADDLLTNLVY